MNATIIEWYGVSRSDEFRIVPIGDTHVGNRSADEHEKALRRLVKEIAEERDCYTILMGDMGEFINVRDPRFDPLSLSEWISVSDLVDVAAAQQERIEDVLSPVIDNRKVLLAIMGNHEQKITQYTERDIYRSLVVKVKDAGGLERQGKVGPGMSGWLILKFHRTEKGEKKAGTATIKIWVHHGFVGGKLAGAKALNMQRLLWNHEADLILMGHDHTTGVQMEAVERVDGGGKVVIESRYGCHTGNWLGQARYAQNKGYFPMPVGYVDIRLRPRAKSRGDMIRVSSRTF